MLKRLLLNFCLALTSIIIILFLLEVAVRIFGRQKLYTVSSYPKELFDSNSLTGMKRNFSGQFLKSEVNGTIKINSKALRDYEREYKKGDKFRILGLGDSFAFGHGVNLEQTYLAILEDKLQKNISNDIEIIKAGFPGGGPSHYLTFLKSEGYKYSPDIALLSFFIGNDIYSERIDSEISSFKSSKQKSKLDLKNDLKTFLRKNLHLYSFIVDRIKTAPSIRKFLVKKGIASGVIGSYVIDILKIDYSNIYKEKWKKVLNILKEINKENRLVLIIIPTREQVDENRLNLALRQIGYSTKEIDIRHPNKILIDFCKTNNIPYIDLLPSFREYYKKDNQELYFEIDPHFNIRGNKLVAEMLYEFFKKKDILRE